MKSYGKSFRKVMANGLEQNFRECKRCKMWIPDDYQILVDHSEVADH